jgi:hypothetical protein
MADYHPLDNPCYEALKGRQAEFAVKGEDVLRYRSDVFVFAGLPDQSAESIKKASELYQKGEIMGIMGYKLETAPYFEKIWGPSLPDVNR